MFKDESKEERNGFIQTKENIEPKQRQTFKTIGRSFRRRKEETQGNALIIPEFLN